MKKPTPAKPPKPTPSESAAGKVSKDEKIKLRGQSVTDFEKEYAELPALTRDHIAEIMVRKEILIDAEALAAFADLFTQQRAETILRQVRGWVEEDQTYPVPASYLGRALKDMNAVGEPKKAKNRIEIMAFFHTGLARAIIRAPKGTERDYRETAKECYEHLAGILETNTESNNASRGLEKPIRTLEKLNLADAQRGTTKGDKDGKKKERRDGTYLRDFGGVVFNGWPRWPGEASGSAAP